ncbi:putative house-cleaning noncanonical NTP pyrophosphatase (MazG superfamily) [Paenibacillus taihuensis]|uniref:Putative house-cleaning noncanonical NTP pyrophosphatase (MazG superfamily) n=1 Tax=Paenibacillus taihuensis TaxID=1156355 RepID=A0A3D9SNH3_9BACL|nr:nucleoside triphosphate pyrophosphohydrolase [Paenibacillus taihuensis]REE90629.1 putative house-cleaning noncanonical NTP pyrophosphatase (MazG superfamily) [Paenibacillus taihuensis]
MPIYNKLVRDLIPEIISNNGSTMSIRKLDEEEYRKELRVKLNEETEEYLSAKSDVEALEELADVLELLYALSESHGFTPEQLEEVRKVKIIST